MTPSADRPLVIAVDGPSGSGKSSMSRGVAERLGLRYLDTGAMYRAITWWVVQHGIHPTDSASVAAHASEPSLTSGTDPGAPTIDCDGIDVSDAIRTAEVTAAVSAVSAVPQVRARLVELQRRAVAEAVGAGTGIVVEGRDIGSVVLPDADLKVYLVASAEERARRRALEDAVRSGAADPGARAEAAVAGTRESLTQRDARDSSRAVSPLARAQDAVEVDATSMTLPEVIDHVVGLVEGAVAERDNSVTS